MDFNKVFLNPEDDMDFMPILPLNENDSDDILDVIPDEIAIFIRI
ncbi:MAG TPA: hypothetical protein PK191_01315 [Niabella sp.]|nr:hypothetical protein [Niabella sp.]